jgi:uncharacterized protein YndB with AHSA1/START domain
MATTALDQMFHTLEVSKEEYIDAPLEVVFESILEQMGPANEEPDGKALPMKLEPWPGGRWFRDFGNNTGHFWGSVQSFKPPHLLEVCGPLFMSTPAVSNVQYRLTPQGDATLLRFSYKAAGWIDEALRDGMAVNLGWSNLVTRVKQSASSHQKGSVK